MAFVYDLVVVTHLLGMAALVGGYLVSVTTGPPRVGAVMLWGARVQLVTGVALVGLAETVVESDLNYAKIGVKLVVSLAVVAFAEVASARARRGTSPAPGPVHLAGALGILNVLVAALWH